MKLTPARLELAALAVTSLALRLVALWALGQGAPFGPDGTGVEAAVYLPGHVYPGHVWLVSIFGSAPRVSVVAGVLTSLGLWAWGRRRGLGGAGGWLHAALPVAVLTGALSGGDAPAVAVVVAGALLATGPGWIAPLLGGALAVASVVVKPSALPAAVLLLATPRALLGAALALPPGWRFLGPLVQPMPGSGLLGTWWLSSGGSLPASAADWLRWAAGGVRALAAAPLWSGALLLLLAPLSLSRGRHLAALGPLLAGLAIAALLGERLEPRYLQAAVVAALPFVGLWLPRWRAAIGVALLLPLSWAVVSQLAAERHRRDAEAAVPALPVLSWPAVGASELFEQCSTDGATTLRRQAAELALTQPHGAQVLVVRRRDGREGELVWPLRVARPDLIIVPVAEGTPGAY